MSTYNVYIIFITWLKNTLSKLKTSIYFQEQKQFRHLVQLSGKLSYFSFWFFPSFLLGYVHSVIQVCHTLIFLLTSIAWFNLFTLEYPYSSYTYFSKNCDFIMWLSKSDIICKTHSIWKCTRHVSTRYSWIATT